MTNRLKQYFPMIRGREELLEEIRNSPALEATFQRWTAAQQEEFLDMCTGVRGVKLLYDTFFKEILNPEYTPERMNRLLSLLLGRQVRIHTVLPGDSTRIADESSLVIMDIVVELADGSLANVEVQKVGYLFPGQRSACYSADLLLRQYRRVRDELKDKFSYRNIQDVYTIILIEQSTGEFHRFPGKYLHYFEQRSDTGLELDLLQKYLFVPLDIFGKTIQNKDRLSETEAWLAFLSQDDPETILRVAEQYPEFRRMYEEVYRMCRNVERAMGIFSEELRILDRNTVEYMVDVMREEIDELKETLEQKDAQLQKQNEALAQQAAQLQEERQLRSEDQERMRRLEARIAELEGAGAQMKKE